MLINSKAFQLYILSISLIISFYLATSAKNINSLELGAVFNFFVPPLIGLITLIIHIILSYIFKSNILNSITTIVFSLINITLGLAFHLNFLF